MTKNLLSWMAAGLAGIVVGTLNYVLAHPGLGFKAVLGFVGSALLVRVANWIVANFAPSPVQ